MDEKAKQRLLALAEMLDSPLPGVFSMNAWERELNCGTSRCVIGWGIHLELLPGLRLAHEPFCRPYPTFQALDDFAALERYFEIEYGEVIYLFGANDKTQGEMAVRLRQFVAEQDTAAAAAK
jgi:hypothetical protein